jgi:DNA-binding beta-propeller fold protein YncE
MKNNFTFLAVLCVALLGWIVACNEKEEPTPEPEQLTATDFVAQLRAPIGFTLDPKGQLWLTEAGTGKNDASVVMITPQGVKTTVATGFPSVIANGAIEGMSHPLYQDGKLYVLHGVSGTLYILDVASFKAGDAAQNLTNLKKEDLGTFVKSLKLTDPLNSNPYDLTFGPDGNLYIADAGANAIFKRDKTTGTLTLFAKLPDAATKVEAVPTGIVFDGTRFLVTTLSGFPFAAGNARLYQITTDGTVSEYKKGFTTLSHLTLSKNNKPIAIQLAEFGAGFQPMTGKVVNEDGKVLLSGLMMPTDIERSGNREFYVLSYALGTIQKLSY